MATAQTIINRAMRLIGALESGESPSADETTDVLAALNAMLDSWRNDSLVVYQIADLTHTLAPGEGAYTIGASGDINQTRPNKIESARVTLNSLDYPVTVIGKSSYDALHDKTTQGTPDALYYDPAYPLGTILLNPVPDAAYTLTIGVLSPLGSLATAGASVALPAGYERALAYNLAIEIAPEFQLSASAEVAKIAAESLASIKRTNSAARPIVARLDYFDGREYNIEAGV